MTAAKSRTASFIAEKGIGPDSFDKTLFTERFTSEMKRGLRREQSSLAMIPTYIYCSAALPDEGCTIAIDAGGTNFRIALVRFNGGTARIEKFENMPMPGTYGTVTWEDFIGFIAEKIRPYLSFSKKIGLCISFPTRITPERDGIILSMTKEVDVRGYEGRHICRDLLAHLGCKDAEAIVLNDTTAVLLSGLSAGGSGRGLIGLINGTGTNICCQTTGGEGVLTNDKAICVVESGGFVPPERSKIDEMLDAASGLPGVYQEEKLVSGAYLGEICRLAFDAAAKEGLLTANGCSWVKERDIFSTPEADALINGRESFGLEADDVLVLKTVAEAVFSRAAAHIACIISAVIDFCEPGEYDICVSADGSVIRKSAFFREKTEEYLAEIEGERKIAFFETDNSTVMGAAIAAAL